MQITNYGVRMVMRLILFTSLIFTLFHHSLSQELKTIEKIDGILLEEYSVLKKNKKVRHGSYIKYELGIRNYKSVVEVGIYDHGQRVGKWYEFYWTGFIQSEGNYKHGKKQGLWTSYYEPYLDTMDIEYYFIPNKGLKINEDSTIGIDRSMSVIMSKGVYHQGERVGAWEYYDEAGAQVHKFDHSLGVLTHNNLPDSVNRNCPFIGGGDRLQTMLYYSGRYIESKKTYTEAEVVLSVGTKHEPFTVEVLKSKGKSRYKKGLIKTLRLLSDDFLFKQINGMPETWIIAYTLEKGEEGAFVYSYEYGDETKHYLED